MRDRKGSTVYRPEIDGLRALAIVPVILFHTGFDAFGGGFIGVDVFFVISGFLITSIILSEMADKKFRLVKFYERRARRILPALFLAFTLSAVLAYFVLLPHQIKDLAQSIAAATLFVSNFFFYLETDYFNEFTSKSPLLHTWTLAVEEQFYLLFPLLLLIVFPLGKVKLNLLVVGLLLTSFVFAVATVAQDRDLAFYGTHTRAWELMVGCVLAINRDAILAWTNARLSDVSERLAYEVAGVLALTGIIFSVLFFSEKTVHPSFITALPVISTAILLLVGHRASVVKAVLAHPVAVLIGLLSYSLYIFHQPISAFLFIRRGLWNTSCVSLWSGPVNGCRQCRELFLLRKAHPVQPEVRHGDRHRVIWRFHSHLHRGRLLGTRQQRISVLLCVGVPKERRRPARRCRCRARRDEGVCQSGIPAQWKTVYARRAHTRLGHRRFDGQ